MTSYGFSQSPEDDVICRFRFIKVDVMSTKEVRWAPANPWFEPGFEKAFPVLIEDKTIKILPLPYFLATKFSAFTARGGRDPRMSHEFEDMVYLLNYTSNFREEVIYSSDEDIKNYLAESFDKILEDNKLQETIIGDLYFKDQMARFERIMQKLKAIVNSIELKMV